MDLFALDDSKQGKPSRAGVDPLVAVGGVHVPSAQVRHLELGIDNLCAEAGFPVGDEFKWSPESGSWMRSALVKNARQTFFLDVLRLAAEHDASALVVIRDTTSKPAIRSSPSVELDAVNLWLERADNHLAKSNTHALVLADRPSGNRKTEGRFLAECLRTLRSGTAYVIPERLTLMVTTESQHVRLLQLADVIVGASLAYFGGETPYSEPIFAAIHPMLRREGDRVGGIGFKVHPDFKYGNLYHWLLGDAWITRGWNRMPLPEPERPFASSPHVP